MGERPTHGVRIFSHAITYLEQLSREQEGAAEIREAATKRDSTATARCEVRSAARQLDAVGRFVVAVAVSGAVANGWSGGC